MAGNLGILLLLGAGVAALALSKKGGPNLTPSTPGGLPPGTGKYDAPGGPIMSMQLEQTVDRELATDTNPMSLLELASSLAPMWQRATDVLTERAGVLNVQPSAAPPPPPPPPVNPPPPVQAPPYVPPVAVPPGGAGTPPWITPPIDPGPAPITPAPSGGVAQWQASYPVPSPNAAIPAKYAAFSNETKGVQGALNAWALAAQYTGNEMMLLQDGYYGPDTQQAAASFQLWANLTQNAGLVVDGLAGAATQRFLTQFGDIPSGPY